MVWLRLLVLPFYSCMELVGVVRLRLRFKLGLSVMMRMRMRMATGDWLVQMYQYKHINRNAEGYVMLWALVAYA